MNQSKEIIKKLAFEAIDRSNQKEELKSFCKGSLNDAINLWLNDEQNIAISKVDELLRILPPLNILHIAKALFYCSLKDSSNSNKNLELVNREKITVEEETMIYYIISSNNLHEKKYDKTIKYANKIIHQNNLAFYAYLPRAMAYAELNEHEKAIKDYKIALKEKVLTEEIKACLAFSYLKTKKVLRSFIILRKAVKKFPDNYRINHNLGVNYLFLFIPRFGLKYLEKAISLNPKFGEAYRFKGLFHGLLGEKELAIQNFLKAKELGEKGIDKWIIKFKLNKNN